jgi:hypothetical protein
MRVFMTVSTDQRTMRFYRSACTYQVDGVHYLRPFEVLAPPASAAPQVYITSPEPFVLQGKSYISLALKAAHTGSAEGSVWVWQMPPDTNGDCNPNREVPLQQKLSQLGADAVINDPENIIVNETAYIYYSRTVPGGVELRRLMFTTGL